MQSQRMTAVLMMAGAAAIAGSRHVAADVIEFTDRSLWEAAVGAFTTIDFTGFAHGTLITEQYAELGAHFTDGTDTVYFNSTAFPNDEYGLDGNGDITVSFDGPLYWIAVDYPGLIQFKLFSGGALTYTSSDFGMGGVGLFAGLLSTDPFDMAVLIDPIGVDAEIDDLHFGPLIPAPPVLALLALAAARPGRRRC